MSALPVARLFSGSSAFNTINVRTVELTFQKSPGKPGDVRGISGQNFEVVKDGSVIQTGTTGADGKIQMRIQGGVSTLRLTTGGTPAEYTVTIRDDAIEAVNTPAGQQRRLRMLGYHIGHTGAEGNGVDGAAAPTPAVDRAVLEFQADNPTQIDMTGIADAANTQPAMTTAAGA